MAADTTVDRQQTEHSVAFDSTVDWAIAAVLAIVGGAVALGGAAVFHAADRATVVETFDAGAIGGEVVPAGEVVDALVAVGWWGGVGLVVTGGLVALVGVAVVVANGRARRDGHPSPRWIPGVVGALVTLLLAAVPLSPVLGGAVGARLDADHRATGLSSGTIAGLLVATPLVLLACFVTVGLFAGLPDAVAAAGAAALAGSLLVAVLYTVLLSAVGGALAA